MKLGHFKLFGKKKRYPEGAKAYADTKNWELKELRGNLDVELVLTLQTHEITNYKLEKTKLFYLYYIPG